MSVGEDQLDRSSGGIGLTDPASERSDVIQTFDIGRVDRAPRTFAPIQDERYGFAHGDRMGYELQHQERIVGLFAFECPSVERLQHLFGRDFPFVTRRTRMRSLLGGAMGGRSGMA